MFNTSFSSFTYCFHIQYPYSTTGFAVTENKYNLKIIELVQWAKKNESILAGINYKTEETTVFFIASKSKTENNKVKNKSNICKRWKSSHPPEKGDAALRLPERTRIRTGHNLHLHSWHNL